MKILYAHPNACNLGDTLVEAGAKYLIHKAIGWHHFHQIWLANVPFVPWMRYDALVLIGTPWFWDGCKTQAKYDQLRWYSRFGAPIRTVLGAGSSFPIGMPWEDEKPPDQAWEAFNPVVVRDPVALNILPKAKLLCCPSLFAAQAFGIQARPTAKRVLVYGDLESTVLRFAFVSDDGKQEFIELQDKLVYDGTDVITISWQETAAFRSRYPGRPCYQVDDPMQLLELIAGYHETISIRIHACAAALSLGLSAKIFPLDTRALTVTLCGAEPLRPMGVMPPVCRDEHAWVHLLTTALAM